MLRNPTAAAAAVSTTEEWVEQEYQKLRFAWEQQLHDTKKHKQETHHHHDNVQFTLMHLFQGYLNQIWMDSQNMLQCAQSWRNDSHQKDAAFTMNILGLHLMKQSLRTRQELFHIVNEASNHIELTRAPSTTSSCSIPSYYQTPVKLSSSPSTPTINNTSNTDNYWQHESATTCKHAFTPGSNYPSYFPLELEQSTACPFCHEKLVRLKKSFSADNFCILTSQISSEEDTSSSSDEDETQAVYHCCHDDTSSTNNSAFDVESLKEDRLASRKLLVQDDNEDEDDGNYNYHQKLLKYQLIRSELHESSKLELEDDHVSVSSSGTTTTTEELRMKRSTINNNLLHERINSSSTCLPESVYSSDDNCNCEEETMPKKKRNLSKFFAHSKSSSTKSSSFKDKLKQYRKDASTTSDKNTMPRSLSNTLCQLFTSQSNKRQQQAHL